MNINYFINIEILYKTKINYLIIINDLLLKYKKINFLMLI